MKRVKPVHLEQSDVSQFKKTIENFERDIEEHDGAILMGVCRGRLSEGLDFKDRRARAVIIVGIPYPSYVDPQIILKRYYLDNKRKSLGASFKRGDGRMIHNIAG